MFGNGNVMRVWQVKQVSESGKYIDVRFSTSKKNADGNYEVDSSGFCRLIGADAVGAILDLVPDARNRLVDFDDKDQPRSAAPSIVPSRVGFSNHYDKEKKREYYNLYVFAFETADAYFGNGGRSSGQPRTNNGDRVARHNDGGDSKPMDFMNIPNGIDEELPFN